MDLHFVYYVGFLINNFRDAPGPVYLVLIPVLLGSSERGERTFVCDENQHGYELVI